MLVLRNLITKDKLLCVLYLLHVKWNIQAFILILIIMAYRPRKSVLVSSFWK